MNVRRTFRNSVALSLAAALPAAALWQIALASAPAHAPAKRQPPLQALATRLHTLLAPAPPTGAPAVTYSTSFHLSDYLAPKYSLDFHAGAGLLKSHSLLPATQDPVTLQPYGASEVVHIQNAAGLTVRAPQSATDTSIGPNQSLTFTVRVNNSTASTQATSVYLQFKDPDSIYDDTNLSGNPREHKVFADDNYTNTSQPSANSPNLGGSDGNTAHNPTIASPPAGGMPPAYFGQTPADSTPDPEQNTSGTASRYIFNGYGSFGGFFDNFAELPYQAFPQTVGTLYYHQRGMVGGRDPAYPTNQFITLGRVDPDGYNTQNPIWQAGPNNTRVVLPGPDPGNIDNGGGYNNRPDYGVFRGVGEEYECQYLNAHDANPNPATPFSTSLAVSGFTGASDAADSDYGDPYYLAGVDDQNTALTPRPEWLTLHPVPGSPDLYSATWASPHSPSDFYIDVVVNDNAGNSRIYDNVWGFSTQAFNAANDILLVIDNALGQKYAASALSGTGGLANLRPFFYGAESGFTATDVSRLPNATLTYVGTTSPSSIYLPPYSPVLSTATPPTNGVNAKGGYPVITYFGNSPRGVFGAPPATPENGLGYHSYGGQSIDDNGLSTDAVLSRDATVTARGNTFNGTTYSVNNVTVPKSQAYSLWRILSRGPVSSTLLTTAAPNGYGAVQPSALPVQPPVTDPVTGFAVPAADGTASPLIPVAPRCIIWVSPFTGDQPLAVPGSLDDTLTQSQLRTFVANGGRLFVTGQEVATALNNEGSASFLNNVLNANYVSDGSGLTGPVDNQTLAGQNSIGHFLSFDSLFDWQAPFTFDDTYSTFLEYSPGFVPSYVAPAGAPLLIANNYGQALDAATHDKWRTDAPLTQEGPYVQPFGNARVQSRISSVSPLNGATPDFSIGANAGMLWHTDNTDAAGSGYGSKVVFASFGLEGLGNDYYHKVNNTVDFFFPRNQRANVLHNIVSYLRTATFTGRIFQGTSTSVGVPLATVYLIPLPNASASHTIPNQTRQAYSALTSDGTDGRPVGSYNIAGVVPGSYRVITYKTGFTRDASPVNNATGDDFAAQGDTTVVVNLNIVQLPPATISGTVTDGITHQGVVGATVTFTATGVTPITTTTGAGGVYSVPAAPGIYTGVAATATSSSPTQSVNVTSSGATGINFVLQVSPGTVTGLVTDNANPANPLPGATVGFYLITGGNTATTATATVTTIANGTFPSPTSGLSPGTYAVQVSKSGYVQTNAVTVTVAAGQAVSAGTIIMRAASTVTLTGIVTDATTANGTPIASATITVKDLANNTVATTPSPIVTDSTGHYSTMLLEGTYNVTASAYSYNSVTRTVTLTASSGTTQNFGLTHATPAYSGYKAGLYNLVSYPYEYDAGGSTPFDGLFGSEFATATTASNRGPALIYSSSAVNYLTEPMAPADGVHLGRGYFVFLKSVAAIYSPLLGTPPTGSTVSVALQGGGSLDGWNMIGVPSTAAVSVSNVQIQFSNGATTSFTNAANSNAAVSPNIYGYNPATNAYYIVGSNGSLQPFQGYWVRAKISGLHIIIPTSGP